jgi:hypothetical protein
MDTTTVIALVVIAAAAVFVVAIGTMLFRRHKTSDLENRYGTEYDRAVKMRGRRKAEAELSAREHRVSSYDLRSLEPVERAEFSDRWTGVQAEFVDAPRTAVQHADVLLQDVMVARGYPMADFEQRAADLSVEYGDLVRNYRSAQATSQRMSAASTEELRHAMLLYRTMFRNLLKVEATPLSENGREPAAV